MSPKSDPSPVPPTSEARHTPGPWTAENHRVFSNIHDLPTLRQITTVTYQRNDAETYANARLIAAAPALLAAAEAASRSLFIATQVMPSDHQAAALKTLQTLEDAIAAARGGVA